MTFQNTLLTINDLAIEYPGSNLRQPIVAVNNFSLKLHHGEVGCLLGSSGCGKSTVLRAVCGFEKLQQGSILLKEQLVSSIKFHMPPYLRGVGMVFQDFALFPHLNVLQNITFGLHHLPKINKIHQAKKWLDLVSLSDKTNAYPHELSGGQQQRVALARAMAPEPDLILLDEPFSSMDFKLRKYLASELRRLLKHNKMTALIVTHDQSEAFTIADKVGVMHQGQLIQWDDPFDIYHQPANKLIAEFAGQCFYISGIIISKDRVSTELGELNLNIRQSIEVGELVDVLLRFNDLVFDDKSPFRAKILDRVFRGSDFLYTLHLASAIKMKAYFHSNHIHQIGESIGISLPKNYSVTFVCSSPS